MDESCSINYAYISCCLIILSNIIYLVFTFIKLFLQHHRRRRLSRQIRKMTDNVNETVASSSTSSSSSSSRMATRSTTTATTAKTMATKTGYERLGQLYPHVGDDIHLPTKWNSKDKASTLALQQNDLVVTYKGKFNDHIN